MTADRERSPPPPRRRRRRWWLGLVGLPLLLLALLAGSLAFANTAPGRALLLAGLERAIDGLEASGLEGTFPQRLTLRAMTLRDAAGVWLEVERAALSWDPLALLSGRLQVERIEAARVAVHRAPRAEAGAGGGPAAAPGLPLALAVDRLAVEELALGAGLLGAPARLKLAGSANSRSGGEIGTRLDVVRLDGPGGRLALEGAYDLGSGVLAVDLRADEPAGGVVAGLLGLPERPAASLSLQGRGPIADWQGRLEASAGSTAIEADLALAYEGDATLARLQGNLRLGALVPPDWRPLAEPAVALALTVRRAAEGALSLEQAEATTPAWRLALSGRVDRAFETVEAEARLSLDDARALAPLLAPASLDGARLSVQAQGPLAGPRMQVSAELTGLDLGEARAGRSTLRATLTPEGALSDPQAALAFEGEGRFEGLALAEPDAARLLDPQVEWQAAGRVSPAAQRLVLSALRLASGPLSARASGPLDLAGPGGELAVAVDYASLERLAEMSGLALAGALRGEATLTLAPDGLSGPVSGRIAGPRTGIAPLDRLLGESLAFSGDLALPWRDDLSVTGLALDAEGVSANGSVALRAGGQTLDAALRARLPELAPLSEELGVALRGAVDTEARLSGPLADPALELALSGEGVSVAGRSLRDAALSLSATALASAPQGRLEAATILDEGKVTAASRFRLDGDGTLALEDLVLRRGASDRVSGAVALPLDGGPASGRLSLAADDLAAWSDLAGMALGGNLEGELRLSDEGGRQTLEAEGEGGALTAALGDGRTAEVGALAFSARIADALGMPRGAAKAEIREAALAEATVERLEAELSGARGDARLTLQGEGRWRRPVALEAALRVAAGEGGVAGTLERFEVTLDETRIGLRRPAAFRYAPPAVGLEGLSLALGEGTLGASLALDPGEARLTLSADAVPLDLVALLAPETAVSGRLDGRLELAGAPTAPEGRLTLEASALRFGEAAATLPPLRANLEGRLAAGRLTLDGSLAGFAEQDLTLSGALPLGLSLWPASLALDRKAPVEGRLVWAGALEPLVASLPVDSVSLAGAAEADLRLAGSLADPRLDGRLAVSDGRYENFVTGTLLQPLEVRVTGSGDRLRIERFEAGDGNGGRLSAEGEIRFAAAGPQAQLVARAERATLVRRDEVTASVNAELRLEGGLEDARLSGRVESERIEARVIDALPREVVSLEVVEVNRPGQPAAPPEAAGAAGGAPMRLALDLEIVLPGRVFLRGRGLDSEWAGQFTVAGTAAAPVVQGQLRPVRGSFAFAGKTFALKEGTITFQGVAEPDPLLDLSAVHEGDGFEAIVRIRGRASAPEITLDSIPELPRDEILSRVLFGKSAGQLSALEAAQLAEAIATLSGRGGTGILETARETLGVDVLEFSGGADDEPGSVTVGRYLADDVYVSVEQGATPGSTEVIVEYEVTPNVTVESRAGATQGSKVGVRWEWDY